jgi:hypothetical protein
MSLDVTTASAIMKKIYPDGIVEVDYSKTKTLALIKKTRGSLIKSPFGAEFHQPVKHGNPQAGSATYATGFAQASSEQSRYKAWLVTPATMWQFADVNGDIVRRGEGVGSFVDALTSEIENAKDAIRRHLEVSLFRTGFGELGQIAVGGIAGAVLTLQSASQVRYFEAGMTLVASTSIDGALLKGAPDTAKILKRNVSAGTITLTAPAPGTWAASDFLFRSGDRQNSATPSRIMPAGFSAWLPSSAPSATPFFGVDRTVDDRLGGLRHNGSLSGSVEEALLDGCSLIDSEGGQASHIVMGPDTYNKLVKSMQNRVHYVETKTDVGVGINGFRINGYGDPMVYSDSACEEGRAYIFNIEDLDLRYAGEDLMYLEETDGLMFRRVQGEDLWRAEVVTANNLILPAPGHACHVFNL